MHRLSILACVICCMLLGCQYGLRRDVLRRQAAEDLSCPRDDVNVTHGQDGYRASGCGSEVRYDCPDGPDDMTEYGDRSCTVVRSIEPPAADGPAAAEQPADDVEDVEDEQPAGEQPAGAAIAQDPATEQPAAEQPASEGGAQDPATAGR